MRYAIHTLAVLTLAVAALCQQAVFAQQTEGPKPTVYSGVYPHLAMFNNEGECGTGAVVPWADRLWVITYGPHLPKGSSDKLYEIDDQLQQTVRPESVGGTPANRMIHDESGQLFIGPYAIDRQRTVRVLSPKVMPGRLTGTARHLTDPAGKIYFATMEEGFYEVDVKTLAVKQLYEDGNSMKNKANDLLPGYHGKGLYSAQGRLIYANNGELSPLAQRKPDIPSGCLAEWKGQDWNVVLRNQFTEVTGPGGVHGNPKPETDPLWAVGWDHRSLILMLLDQGQWNKYRLPKASHSYDGAHGWNTEWPRIREIGDDQLLMTMHGMFWRFPKTFTVQNSAGLAPRSTYLKVIGDFCRWGDQVVFGCDDTAKNEFLNKRKVKGHLAGPGQSHSNLWFVSPDHIDRLGPAAAAGAVWWKESVKHGQPSDPFLFSGFARRMLHLANDGVEPLTLSLEVDVKGSGDWRPLREVELPAGGYLPVSFDDQQTGAWVRITSNLDASSVSALFSYTNDDPRPLHTELPADPKQNPFAGLASLDAPNYSAGVVRVRGENKRNLHFASVDVVDGKPAGEGLYELSEDASKLTRVDDPTAHAWLKQNAAVPTEVLADILKFEPSSVLFIDDSGRRFRLPRGASGYDQASMIPLRVDREVCTERDLFHCHGTFYELPAENAGGFAKIRPVAAHNRRIADYCSYRGLLVLSGVSSDAPESNSHILRSDDGRAALWLGAVDDLWKLGKPVGVGGPWLDSPVSADVPSDPYLFRGYDRKTLTLSHTSPQPLTFHVEFDPYGTGDWRRHSTLTVPSGAPLTHTFSPSFQAYWLRIVPSTSCTATAQLVYE